MKVKEKAQSSHSTGVTVSKYKEAIRKQRKNIIITNIIVTILLLRSTIWFRHIASSQLCVTNAERKQALNMFCNESYQFYQLPTRVTGINGTTEIYKRHCVSKYIRAHTATFTNQRKHYVRIRFIALCFEPADILLPLMMTPNDTTTYYFIARTVANSTYRLTTESLVDS